MAKKSAIEKNNRRIRMVKRFARKRKELKEIATDRTLPIEDRFAATLQLAQLPRNANPTRIRNRCEVTGRPRSVYRRFRMSRIALRELASSGQIPGVTKSSW